MAQAGSDAAVSALRSLKPDPKEMMASHDGSMITGVSVGCRATDPHYDFYSRSVRLIQLLPVS